MNKYKILLFFFILSSFSFIYSNPIEVPDEIIIALNKGDVNALIPFLNESVELSIENKNDIYSKQQAKSIISDFFSKNNINKFNLLHKGEKEAACFIIGTLNTSNGSYRLYILTRKNNNKDLIQQFRIEPSNE